MGTADKSRRCRAGHIIQREVTCRVVKRTVSNQARGVEVNRELLRGFKISKCSHAGLCSKNSYHTLNLVCQAGSWHFTQEEMNCNLSPETVLGFSPQQMFVC